MENDTHEPQRTNPSAPPPPEIAWDDRRAWGRRYHRHHHHHHPGHGIVPGLVIIAWGGLLLAREMGWIDPGLHAMDFWPLILVGFGLAAVVRPRSLPSLVVGGAAAALGVGLLAERLGYPVPGLPNVWHLWPLLVVAIGLSMLWHGMFRRGHRLPVTDTVSSEELRRSVTMGGLDLVVDSQQLRGGTITATMSGVKLDLRRAALAGEEATLQLSLLMSGLELYVPPHWKVQDELEPFAGAVEDRTEPRPDARGEQRRLVLRGNLTMGAVTIRN